jgi:hypothetical protein
VTSQELDAFLRVAKEHGLTRLNIVGVVVADFAPVHRLGEETRKPEEPPKDEVEKWERVERDLLSGPIA